MRRRAPLAALLLLFPAVAVAGIMAVPVSLYTTTATIRLADPVERRIFATGVKPEEFYFSFTTKYAIDGQPTSAAVWWRTPKTGLLMQVKAVKRVGFWWGTRVNLIRRHP